MKIGVRKPSIKKSIAARTYGRGTRSIKKAIIPGYGRKGMGYINSPKKAIYNNIYHRATVSVNSSIDNTPTNNGMGVGELIVTIFQLIFAIGQLIFYGALLFGLLYFIFVIIF